MLQVPPEGVALKDSVKFSDTMEGCPAAKLVFEGTNAMIQEGLRPASCGMLSRSDTQVFWVESDTGEVLSVITVFEDCNARRFVISSAYTEPSSRRLGMFRLLLSEVVRVANRRGLLKVDTILSMKNSIAHKCIAKCGASPKEVLYSVGCV